MRVGKSSGWHRSWWEHRDRLRAAVLALLVLFCALWGSAAWAGQFLSPDQAFRFSAESAGAGRLALEWQVAPGYHLYRSRVRVQLAPSNVQMGKLQLPPGKLLDDPAFGKVQVLEGDNRILLPYSIVGNAPKEIQVTSEFQGCANAGICYPQQKKTITVSLAPKLLAESAPLASSSSRAATSVSLLHPAKAPQSNAQSLASSLRESFGWTLVLFFVSGLGLAFTPCVFPMIPILSGIIVGQKERPGRTRAFALSLAYVLGMALTYTIAGIAAALTGAYLQAFFQSPWVIGIFALIFLLLALSMFGFYDLQMPNAIQSRLSRVGKGEHLFSSFVMGILSALIVGPCVAAPLAGGLLFVSQTGNVLLGALALFALSLGMGVPLLVIGTSAGHFLPKAGAWMDGIKAIFGVLMLGVAIWFLSRILPGSVTLLLWALLAIFSGVYLRALEPAPAGGWSLFRKALGVALLAYGLVMGVGALQGQSDPLHPLAVMTSGPATSHHAAELSFQMVKSPAALQAALQTARGKPVLVDYWASWCVECARMDKIAFRDPAVEKALRGYTLIRVDVTASDADSQALLKRYQLAGPPAFIHIDSNGRVAAVQEGYLGPDAFLHWLDRPSSQ
ncbi:protein-disulfide reductase DsbD [Acidithiobacillus sp. CV18-2]|uniref:Thiol:disulfide interchange protein DsbD n=1 Tax=Igneacidithiobacillus copahuensis TaxID=2724909 RepID=A0AAE2YSF3_9PROT|nr:protein-disulfide reductase DsbD [Acidithiobacillus sp. CV18-3]MBU2757016.1 protein-disulfide reductase DsbD [Acidithiobacillus sp. BN09-2]MBU2777814.1 protein-disulfide reductase DsbD [Acidithiobacillus sp. CV18-2]MBU2788940.1 protein-disulfide reductase DsbD [Igneacidithiobacillus copahuensis]MBU2795561.1 protein-disulfide reductase DsbD [Acidithiobacillus sp. VAN18-2]MBU2798789.1 protein-disulfide reductase DsbD [Acidithiobacillus sp. VAN18-4]